MFTRTPLVSGSHATRSRGLTIVEMLVSLACVIILMLAYTQLFSDVGGRIRRRGLPGFGRCLHA